MAPARDVKHAGFQWALPILLIPKILRFHVLEVDNIPDPW
jgi:hypothetical protein